MRVDLRVKRCLAFAGICFFWGTSNLVTKIGVGGLSVPVFASLRYLVAGLLMLTLALSKGQRLPRSWAEKGRLLLIGAIMHFGTNGCVVLSNKFIDSGIVTILLATVPIFAALIQIFVLRTQRLSLWGAAGLTGGFAGILLVAAGGAGRQVDARGIALGLLGACLWAVGSMLSAQTDLRSCLFAATAMQMLFASGLFVAVGTATGSYVLPPLSWEILWPAVYMAVVDSTLGFLLYSWLLQVWDPLKASTYAYINPVVALILGALILNEAITPAKLAGMVLIVFSVYLIQRKRI